MSRSAQLLVAIALAMSACTSGGATTTTSVSSTPSSLDPSTTTTTKPPDGFGGTVTVGIEAPVGSLNPFSTTVTGETSLIGAAVWATVYDIDPTTWERIPDTVTSLPTQVPGAVVDNGDGTVTVEYQIAPRATWSDGVPISGADLAFTAQTLRDLARAGNPAVDPVMASVVDADAVEKVAWITFDHPSLAFEDALWIILPSHVLAGESVTASDGTSWPAGGPFMVSGQDPTTLVRNPNYWKTDGHRQLPYADAIEFRVVSDPIQAVKDREVEMVEELTGIPDAELDGIGRMQSAPTPFIEQLSFNFIGDRDRANPASRNDDLSFRTAIAHAVDRAATLDEAGVPWAATVPGLIAPTGVSPWAAYVHNAALATDFIMDLPNPTDVASVLSTTNNGPDRPAIADALASAFADTGVRYSTKLLDSIQFYGDTLPSGAWDLGLWAWENDGGYAATLELLDRFDPAGAGAGLNGWGTISEDASSRFSELVSLARSTVDPVEFATFAAEADQILATELPVIPLFIRSSFLLVADQAVTGAVHNGTASRFTWNSETWQVVGE
ncbi:MAG: ABC transporter substrate-binding protein [Acidimicrobiia bacterium]